MQEEVFVILSNMTTCTGWHINHIYTREQDSDHSEGSSFPNDQLVSKHINWLLLQFYMQINVTTFLDMCLVLVCQLSFNFCGSISFGLFKCTIVLNHHHLINPAAVVVRYQVFLFVFIKQVSASLWQMCPEFYEAYHYTCKYN